MAIKDAELDGERDCQLDDITELEWLESHID